MNKNMTINSYLTFNGNCREAMEFYQKCLGGNLVFQTVGESPMSEKIPATMKDYILHATLTNGSLILMGSDMGGDQRLIKGTSVSLMLNCSSAAEINNCYEALSMGGQRNNSVEDTFWGALFGDLTDKYGNHWLLHFDQSKPIK
ncbi:MAG TPA: VOC family protein [Sphingobacteriaceae bacterium]